LKVSETLSVGVRSVVNFAPNVRVIEVVEEGRIVADLQASRFGVRLIQKSV